MKTGAAGKLNGWLDFAVVLSLGIVMAGCKPGDTSKKPATPQASGTPGSSPAVAARSPKEQAVAEFLQTVKLEGKPVLIEFGMVGCELSGTGLDSMISLAKADAIPGLHYVRVESGSGGADVEDYFKQKAPPFPIYRDSQATLAKSLSATAYPTFVLVDKFGHIRYEGKYPQENLQSWGRALAAETKDPGSNVALFGAVASDVPKLLAAELPDLKDNIKPLGQYMGAGGLMVLFVDTSCPFSATALKEMPTVGPSLAAQKINAVVLNNDDPKEKVLAFYAKADPGVPVLYDVSATSRRQWNVHSVPIAVYISPTGQTGYKGEAIWANVGAAAEKSLQLAAGTIKFNAAGTGFG